MSRNKPLAGGIGADADDGGAGAPVKKWVGKDDYKKRQELDEARKAGNAPAEVDVVTGKEINPHIPAFMLKTPWFYGVEGGNSLVHQGNLKEQKHVDGVSSSYNKGFTGRATKYRDGACQNCGSMTHAKKDCFYRPRKQGAARTGADIMPDEIVPQQLSLDYDGKRDRWAGYDAQQYSEVVSEYEKLDELRRKAKAQQLMEDLIAKGEEPTDAAAAAAEKEAALGEEEFVEGEDGEMLGQHFDNKTRMTVRNLRIREDTAKYLYNLDPNSAHYDPKSRSMRADPLPHVPMEEKPFAGDNFVRAPRGDAKTFNEVRLFAWEAQEMGMDVDEVGAPSLASKKFAEYQERKKETETARSRLLAEQYGTTATHSIAIPQEVLTGATEVYREYARDGTLLKGPEPMLPVSRYAEDVHPGNHTSVWGSYWKDFKWGYACCHQHVKNAVCTGEAGKRLAAANLMTTPGAAKAFAVPAAATEAVPEDTRKSDKKAHKKSKKKHKKEHKKEKKDKKRDRTELTEADMEEYRRTRSAFNDPMKQYMPQ